MKFFSSIIWIIAPLCCLHASSAIPEDKNGLAVGFSLSGYSFQLKPSLGKSKYFEANSEQATIHLRFISVQNGDVAEAFIEDKLALFKSIYQGKRVDYPGQFSKVIDCPDQFKPNFFPGSVADGKLGYFLGFANKNKVPGSCAADLVSFRYFYGLLYCKNRSEVIEMEAFFNLNEDGLKTLIQDISCAI